MNNITKEQIIILFNQNIKGKIFKKNKNNHDGEEGHWIEQLLYIKPNSKNAPDLGGYEIKKDSKKITFGDWSGEYLFSEHRENINNINKEDIYITKENFIKLFGKKTENKNRYSWSGSCIPKYNIWNNFGQKLIVDDNNNIIVLYSYNNDNRKPIELKKWINKEISIVLWKFDKMYNFINNKFNKNGFIILRKNNKHIYNNISFGSPITYDYFLEQLKLGIVYLDSGMYYDYNKPNNRLYSQWRANQNFWNNLIIDTY